MHQAENRYPVEDGRLPSSSLVQESVVDLSGENKRVSRHGSSAEDRCHC